MTKFSPGLLLCGLLLAGCRKADPGLDSALLLGTWRQQRETITTYDEKGMVLSAITKPYADRYLFFKMATVKDSSAFHLINPCTPTFEPYTLQGNTLSYGYSYGPPPAYTITALTAHTLTFQRVLPPLHPLPPGVTQDFVTEYYYGR